MTSKNVEKTIRSTTNRAIIDATDVTTDITTYYGVDVISLNVMYYAVYNSLIREINHDN